eukprot:239558_1
MFTMLASITIISLCFLVVSEASKHNCFDELKSKPFMVGQPNCFGRFESFKPFMERVPPNEFKCQYSYLNNVDKQQREVNLYFSKSVNSINVHVLNKKDYGAMSSDYCLQFAMEREDPYSNPFIQKCEGSAGFIGAEGYCDINPWDLQSKGRGDWLMHLRIHLLCIFNINTGYVTDGSYMTCQTNDKPVQVKFSILRAYEDKKSWYERFGYVPNFNMEELREHIQNMLWKTVKNYTANFNKQFVNELNQLVNWNDTDTLGKKMIQLWHSDCAKYSNVQQILEQVSEMKDLFNKYTDGHIGMVLENILVSGKCKELKNTLSNSNNQAGINKPRVPEGPQTPKSPEHGRLPHLPGGSDGTESLYYRGAKHVRSSLPLLPP